VDDALREHLSGLAAKRFLPKEHVAYLQRLRRQGFRPKVIYDIGSCLLHWTTPAQEIWPEAEIVLFDAFEPAAFLYGGRRHWIGVLSDQDGREVRFWQNDRQPGGNSYYREGGPVEVFPVDASTPRRARTLDAVVAALGLPPPDLVKIDVQGAEKDVIAGGSATLAHATHLIVEMQRVPYNLGAPLVTTTRPWIEAQGWACVAPLFCDNGPDGDYGFVRSSSLDCDGPG
jgi:FkbM family methyltransferase